MKIPLKDLEKHIEKGLSVFEAFDREEAEARRRADAIKHAGPIHGAVTPLGFRRLSPGSVT